MMQRSFSAATELVLYSQDIDKLLKRQTTLLLCIVGASLNKGRLRNFKIKDVYTIY